MKVEEEDEDSPSENRAQNDSYTLYEDYDVFGMPNSVASNLGIKAPDLAPDVDSYLTPTESSLPKQQQQQQQPTPPQLKQSPQTTLCGKKIYAKEAWPGRKSQPGAAEVMVPQVTKTPTVQQQTSTKALTISPPHPQQKIAPPLPSPPASSVANPTRPLTGSTGQKRLII